MKNRLTKFGWFVIVIVVVTVVAACMIGHEYGWYWGVVTALGGFAMLCIVAAFTGKKKGGAK